MSRALSLSGRDVLLAGRVATGRERALAKALLAAMMLPMLTATLLVAAAWANGVSAAPVRLHVFAAASLVDVMEELSQAFERGRDVEMVVVAAGTATLAQQIVAGASADIFISANRAWGTFVTEQVGFSAPVPVFVNRLVVVASDGSVPAPGGLGDLADALEGGRLAMGDPDYVPAGIYARQALQAAGVWDGLVARLAPASDVRSALQLVAAGAARLGIVYRTDVVGSDLPVVLDIDPALHDPIIYHASYRPQPEDRQREMWAREFISF
ncbi:MAG TPA: molybdate ABC transporter substrate-binding protein, partial [Devosia sp.]|nr:molybdate ABC transporter substrate-binding protein [Devosia sp.]